jgi:hypothetical protein
MVRHTVHTRGRKNGMGGKRETGKKNTAARVARAPCLYFACFNQEDATRRGDEGQARDRGEGRTFMHMSAAGGLGIQRNARKHEGHEEEQASKRFRVRLIQSPPNRH